MTDSTNNDTPEGEETSSADHDAAVAASSVEDHDEHQDLVDHEPVDTAESEADAWQKSWDAAGGGTLDGDAKDHAGIEPTVITPSALRGHSHDTGPQDVASATPDVDGDAATPPTLVEPPRLSLRGSQRPDLEDTAPFPGLGAESADDTAADDTAASGEISADKSAAVSADDELAATQAMPLADDVKFEVGDDAVPTAGATAATAKAATIVVDDETARAAATGTPIVLVETPTPPRKKGARGVGFVVVLLSTAVFGALLLGAMIGVSYLFDRDFSLDAILQSFWMQPSWILPVVAFFLVYWIATLILNKAGWWAHVLGGFIVALVTYAAHLAGTHLEAQEQQWDVGALMSITLDDLGPMLLAPMAIATFILAREVPIWLGGIVARRGRKAREFNRTALEEFERENAERLAEYEASRA